MDNVNPDYSLTEEEQKTAGQELPSLPGEFYEEILGLPSCIMKGECDNCDRCGF